MGRLSGSYWDWNPHMPPALAAQKADYVFGGCVIVAAFVLQLASFFVPPEAVALSEKQAAIAPWIATAITIAMFVVLRKASHRVARFYERQINAWLKQKSALLPPGT